MSTIKTTFDSGAGDDQDITIANLSAREIPLDEARDGLILSPGLLVIIPRGGTCYFQIESDIVEAVPYGGVIVSGYSKVRLSVFYENDKDACVHVLEIGATINGASRLKDLLPLPYLLDTDTTTVLSGLYRMLIDVEGSSQQMESTKELTKHLIAGRIVNALLKLSSRQTSEKPLAQKDLPQVERLKKFLFANLHRKVTTVDMAAVIGFSRDHFCVWAKSQLGKPPARFLRELRMEHSLDKLLNSTESIESIAEQIGYADRYHFGKEFKKHFGTPPAQLRKEHARKDRNYVSRVEASLKLFKPSDALAVCEEALGAPGVGAADLSQLKLLRGHCLKALGEYSKAMSAWGQVEGPNHELEAGVLRCQLAFEYDKTDTALEEMARLWSSDGANHADLIQVWVQHVTILCNKRCSHDLRGYLDFRKTYFISNEASEHAALAALRGIGSDLEILEQCPRLRYACFRALLRAGLYARALAEYGGDIDSQSIARLYLEAGDYDRVLSTKPLIPRYCAQAMIKMGRPTDAIRGFPEDSERAYIVLEKYDDLLNAIPEITWETVYALIKLGRLDELRQTLLKGSYYHEWAQCYLDPESIISEKLPDINGHLVVAQILTAFKWLTQGRKEDAISLLNTMDTVRSPNLWPWLQNAGVFLLVSVVKAMLGQAGDLDEDLGLICQNYRYLNRQTVYYDAAYLRGTITANDYQDQPMKDKLFIRWVFARSLAHDLNGRYDDACKGYGELLQKTSDFELINLIRHRFSDWRLAELGQA